jgi:hypothetical protein
MVNQQQASPKRKEKRDSAKRKEKSDTSRLNTMAEIY